MRRQDRARHAKPARGQRATRASLVAGCGIGLLGVVALVGTGAHSAAPTPQNSTGVVADSGKNAQLTGTTTSKAQLTLGGWLPYWEWSKKPPTRGAKTTLGSLSAFETTITGTSSALKLTPPQTKLTWNEARAQWSTGQATTWLSVTDYSSAGALAGALKDPDKRSNLIQQLTVMTVEGNYTGLDLDLEGFAYRDGSRSWPQTQPHWVSFVKEAAAALKTAGKQLSVTSPPIYNDKNDGSSGYWVYSWKGIGPHIDKLRIMAYDYSYTYPGPIGPLKWTDNILSYATKAVEPHKIELAIPSYGRNWVTQVQGTCPTGTNLRRTTLDMNSAQAVARLRGAPITYNTTHAEATFSYHYSAFGAPNCVLFRTLGGSHREPADFRVSQSTETARLKPHHDDPR